MSDPLCQRATDDQYVYLPAALTGARVRLPMDLANPATGCLAAPSEAVVLFWPLITPETRGRAATIALDGDGHATAELLWGWPTGLRSALRLSPPFWSWWAAQRRAGATELLLRCDDGPEGRVSAIGLNPAALEAGAVAATTAALRATALAVLKRAATVEPTELARRLLARGVYHGAAPPDPLPRALFDPPGTFVYEFQQIGARASLTPALVRLFAHRLTPMLDIETASLTQQIGLAPPDSAALVAADEDEDVSLPPRTIPPAQAVYRLKVALTWDKDIWRVIEILDNQTLDHLHDAIQEAFNWDNDHLYAFYLSGQVHDSLTAVDCPLMGDAEPPLTDEVLLADLGLRRGQRFLYLFDFGDELTHDITLLETLPAPPVGPFPRVAESHGEAPPQYPNLEEDEDDEDWDE